MVHSTYFFFSTSHLQYDNPGHYYAWESSPRWPASVFWKLARKDNLNLSLNEMRTFLQSEGSTLSPPQKVSGGPMDSRECLKQNARQLRLLLNMSSANKSIKISWKGWRGEHPVMLERLLENIFCRMPLGKHTYDWSPGSYFGIRPALQGSKPFEETSHKVLLERCSWNQVYSKFLSFLLSPYPVVAAGRVQVSC